MFFEERSYERNEWVDAGRAARDTLMFGTCLVTFMVCVGIIATAVILVALAPLGLGIFAELYLESLG